MDAITIRPATSADMQRLIDIMYDDPPGDMRAIAPDVRKAKLVGALVMRAGIEVDVRRSVVAAADGRPVGLLETRRPGDRADQLPPLAVAKVLVRGLPIIGLGGLLRYFRYQKARANVQIDYPPDSYYVRELDADPTWRNRGIGARLLEHAESEAREMRVSRMSLCTGISNPAQHLYVRAGYRIVETRRDADCQRLTGNPGRVLMVKDLG
jgi:ribosomal protein S18 acetylase RimI-like enzyme